MGYLNITWTRSAPTSRGMSNGNATFLCSGNAPAGLSNPHIITSTNYTSLIPTTRWEYTALQSYFKNTGGSPTNTTRLYWMGAGEGITGIAAGTGTSWYIKYPPFSSIDTVSVDPTGGTNWQAIAAFAATTCPSGYVGDTGLGGQYNGYVLFSGYLDSDGVDIGGPYFESGFYSDGTTAKSYSGTEGRDIMHLSGGRIRVLATRNGFGVAGKAILPLDNQFICPSYDTTNTGSSGCLGLMGSKTEAAMNSTGSIEDFLQTLGICAGNRMMAVWAMPAGAVLNKTYHNEPAISGSPEYQNIRDYVGQDQNAIVIQADVSTGTDGTGNDCPAAAYLGKIVSTGPHQTLNLATISLSQNTRSDENDRAGWDAGQIACVFQKTNLGFTSDQISHGFTFAGTSPENRLNNVRCKYIIEFNVLADLWTMLSSGKIRISKAGLGSIIDVIKATLNRMESQDILDSGTRTVEIPLINGTDAEWTAAKLTYVIPAIRVRWSWKTSPEQLNLTEFGEII